MPDDQLDKLKKDLYARNESEDLQKRQEDVSALGVRRPIETEVPTNYVRPEHVFVNTAEKAAQRRKKIFIIAGSIAGILAVVGVAFGGTWWYRSSRQVQTKQLVVEIRTPKEITSGDVVTYEINYRNESKVTWNNAEISFTLPRGFLFRTSEPAPSATGKQYVLPVGTVQPGQAGIVKVEGQLLGEQNTSALSRAELFITPENFPSGRFSKAIDNTIIIAGLPFEVAIDAPKDAGNGDRLVATLQMRNTGTTALKNVYLKVKAEGQASFAVDDPAFSPDFSVPDARWLIANIEPLQTVTRNLVLYADGRPGEQRKLEIEAGVIEQNETFIQRTISHVVTITSAQLAVEQLFNDKSGNVIAMAGEAVTAKIKYQNIGTTGLKDVRVTTQLEGIAFDPASLKLPAGAYDPKTRTITWTAATVPDLRLVQPQQSGEITFTFTILPTDNFPKTGDDLKNYVLVSTATIDSTDEALSGRKEGPISSDRLVLSVKSDPILQIDSFYDDGRLGIKSTGPLPPTTGQQTTYTIRVRAGSTLNDTGELSITTVLPDGVQYMDKVYKTAGEIRFNDRTGEVSWLIPLIASGVGRIKPAEEFYFQVAITPGENQRGEDIDLLNKATFEGIDEFVDQAITKSLTEQDLPSTEKASPGQGIVQ